MTRHLRSPAAVWALLLAATALTFAAGEWAAPERGLMVGVLVLAAVKGRLVLLDWMELRHAPALWRHLVGGWLLLVVAGIVLTYLKGSP